MLAKAASLTATSTTAPAQAEATDPAANQASASAIDRPVEELSDGETETHEDGYMPASQVSVCSDPHLQASLAAVITKPEVPTLQILEQTREALARDRGLTLQAMHQATIQAEAEALGSQVFRDETDLDRDDF